MKISIVVATYNGEKFLKEQLASFQRQSLLPDEIIISDDGSSDSTMSILQNFKNQCNFDVKILVNRNKHGVTCNFENAAKYATGDIVFFSDQDDVWYENKIEVMVNALNKYPDCIGAFCDADCVDSKLNKYNVTFNENFWGNSFSLPFDNENICIMKNKVYLSTVVERNIIGGCCLVIKNKYLKQMFNFCPYIFHDDWLCFCMFVLGDVVALNMPLFAYRLHSNNTVGFSNNNENNKKVKRLFKKVLKLKRKLSKLSEDFIADAERAIYFNRFASTNNISCATLEYQWNLSKRKINAMSLSKIEALKEIRKISEELHQYKSSKYYFECLYIFLFSKKRRTFEVKKYIEIFEKENMRGSNA